MILLVMTMRLTIVIPRVRVFRVRRNGSLFRYIYRFHVVSAFVFRSESIRVGLRPITSQTLRTQARPKNAQTATGQCPEARAAYTTTFASCMAGPSCFFGSSFGVLCVLCYKGQYLPGIEAKQAVHSQIEACIQTA